MQTRGRGKHETLGQWLTAALAYKRCNVPAVTALLLIIIRLITAVPRDRPRAGPPPCKYNPVLEELRAQEIRPTESAVGAGHVSRVNRVLEANLQLLLQFLIHFCFHVGEDIELGRETKTKWDGEMGGKGTGQVQSEMELERLGGKEEKKAK